MKLDEKGQSYLIVSFILATIMVTVAFVSREPVHQKTEGHFLMENIERELPLAYTAGEYQNDLNDIITDTSNEFKDFAAEKGYKLKLVFAAQNQIGIIRWYWIGNWWGEDCTYYNSRRDPVNIPNGTTKFITRLWLLNDYDLYVCGNPLDLTEDFDYRAEIHREGEVIINGSD